MKKGFDEWAREDRFTDHHRVAEFGAAARSVAEDIKADENRLYNYNADVQGRPDIPQLEESWKTS